MNTKKLFFFAIAALGLAACSNDEVVETIATSEANEISFRPLVTNVTRAADDADLNTDGFIVTAFNSGGSDYTTAYIKQVAFTGTTATSFNSTDKYYWPSTGTLDFYAYSPSGNNQITYTAYNQFTVTPAQTSEIAGSQVDLIYAAVKNKGKSDATNGQIPLNFRHAGAKIALKVTHANSNTAKSLKFKVKAWAVGYLDNSATFTFPDYATNTTANTTDHNDGSSDSYLLPSSYWTNNTGYATDKQIYRTTDLGAAIIVAGTAVPASNIVTNHTFAEEMILIPQTGASVASTYDANTTNSEPNGTFVAVKLTIEDINTSTVIVPETWAMWPATVNWVPGKKYTYNVQLDEGGYYEKNPDNDNNVLDPIFKGAVISFATVTVDEWRAAAVDVPAAPGS